MATNDDRLPPDPSQQIDRSRPIHFTYNGRRVKAYVGDTVASALYAAGQRIFSRSFKYHRPRGLLCVSGRCPNCLANVDGTPNVRSCTEPIREGMEVHSQNAWPSLEHDIASLTDKLDWALPVGFYYKTFIHPRSMWGLAERFIRHMGGIGSINVKDVPERRYEHSSMHTDVAVVGGGPAGMTAALEAAAKGAKVTIIDDQAELGGHLRYDHKSYSDIPDYKDLSGHDIARKMAEAIKESNRIKVIPSSTAFGLYEGNLLAVLSGSLMTKLRSKQIIVATGAQEVPAVFQNNDLPGVMLGSAALKLINLWGLKIGKRAVVATTSDSGYTLVEELLRVGITVAAVVDSRINHGGELQQRLKGAGVDIISGSVVGTAYGSKRLSGITVMSVSEDGASEAMRLKCDLLCLSVNRQPSAELLYQGGCELEYDQELGETIPLKLKSGIHAAGDITGIHSLRASLLQGRITGIEAAVSASNIGENAELPSLLSELHHEKDEIEEAYRKQVSSTLPPVNDSAKKKFVCICEDVTEKDIRQAIDEGFDDIQTLKRFSTVTMGPCQGKMCSNNTATVCASKTGRDIAEIGTTTSRPPIQPVRLGVLAGPNHMPQRLTPIHGKHLEARAEMMDAGQWRRPHHYNNIEDEYRAVRERVGIIDVSTLGKLDVRGEDAPLLLDYVYTNIHSNLAAGRTRYGIICSEAGIILDDGSVSHLPGGRLFVTTTSGGAETMEGWFRWWVAAMELRVQITNITAGFAAVNLAGPKARDVLKKLTDIDLTTSAFPYMGNSRTIVAGVPAILIRLGFVGETGWEIHFPAEYGEYMWDSLLSAGKEFGISPFGVEAQRILRLEKRHILVGHDTDAMSDPWGANMAWAIKMDKEDFVGRGGLSIALKRNRERTLVGFIMGEGVIADDGNAVVIDDRPVGWVTSSRFSPTLGRGFGMAWVPPQLAEGRTIQIKVDGRLTDAELVFQPFYDPKGKKLRD